MPNNRPVVFIGSSTEGLPIAKALQVNLDYVADVVVWCQGVFGLSEGSLESLVDRLSSFDYAILVLTPDDVAIVRDDLKQLPRDNVLFELGLFMGGLGRERCFIVYDRTCAISLPSDLAGVTPATFHPHASGELRSALGSAATQVESVIAKLGCRQKGPSDIYIDSTTQYRVIADLLDVPSQQMFILMRETGVQLRREDWMLFGVRQEYYLGEHKGLGHGYFRVNELCKKLADAGLLAQDLRGNVTLTERGNAFAEWLINSGYRAEYFWCDYGTWGDRPQELNTFQHPSEVSQTPFEIRPASPPTES
jgi:hypothetical protein